MIKCNVRLYTKAEKKPKDYESVIVFFDGHRAPDYFDPYDDDFHYYGKFMKSDDLWMEMPDVEALKKYEI